MGAGRKEKECVYVRLGAYVSALARAHAILHLHSPALIS